MNSNPNDQCAQRLAALEGNAFQDGVTTLVMKNHLDFQAIPAAPQGDGGLDGLVSGDTVGYCCYGIQDIPSHSAKELNEKLVEKFRDDLLRILELEPAPKKAFAHKPNTTLEKIIPDGKRLKHIYVVCNCFGSNAAIGTLKTFFDKAKKVSKLRFVEADCSLTIEGPAEISKRLTVSADLLAQLDQSVFAKLLAEVPTQSTLPPAPESTLFEKKLAALEADFGKAAVDPLRNELKRRWLEHLALMEKLNSSVPKEHAKVFRVVGDIRREIALKFFGVGVDEAVKRLQEYEEALRARLRTELPLSEQDARKFAGQVTASLVGECGINWL